MHFGAFFFMAGVVYLLIDAIRTGQWHFFTAFVTVMGGFAVVEGLLWLIITG